MAGLVGIRAEDMDQVDALQRARIEWPHGLPFVRPSVRVPILIAKEGKVDYAPARFGFSRRFTSFNARQDKLTESRLWKGFFGKSHGIAPLSYVVEWIEEKGKRQAYLIGRADRKLMMVPALFGRSLDNKEEFAFAAVTRDPNHFFSHFHDRMVGVLAPDQVDVWLNPEGRSVKELLACVRAPEEGELAAWATDGDITKRKTGDWSALKTKGEPVTSGSLK